MFSLLCDLDLTLYMHILKGRDGLCERKRPKRWIMNYESGITYSSLYFNMEGPELKCTGQQGGNDA